MQKPALTKIKEIGDLGAHGYAKVTKQRLDKYQDDMENAIQELIRTARRSQPSPPGLS